MPRFNVLMAITNHKTITVYADDEDEAEEKACDIVSAWKGVEDCEAVEIEEA